MKYVSTYLLCMYYLPFLFVMKSLHRLYFVFFSFHICQSGNNSIYFSIFLFFFSIYLFFYFFFLFFYLFYLFFCKNRELYDLGTSHSPIEHHWFPRIWSKVGKLADWLFFQLSKSLRNTDKEFCPVGKLSFSVSVNRKVKNILCYTSDPAS